MLATAKDDRLGHDQKTFRKGEMPSFLHYIGLYVIVSTLYSESRSYAKSVLATSLMHYESEKYAAVQRTF